MHQGKWSILRVMMVVLAFIYILARISNIIYMLQYSGMPIFFQLFFLLLVEILLLIILIFVSSKYRFLAIIPLLFLIVATITQQVNFITTTMSSDHLPQLFVIQYLGSNLLRVILFIIFSILLLPFFRYKFKHGILIGSLIVPSFIFYSIQLFSNMRYIGQQSIIEFFFRVIIINLVLSLSLYVIFTLYIIEHTKKQAINTHLFE